MSEWEAREGSMCSNSTASTALQESEISMLIGFKSASPFRSKKS